MAKTKMLRVSEGFYNRNDELRSEMNLSQADAADIQAGEASERVQQLVQRASSGASLDVAELQHAVSEVVAHQMQNGNRQVLAGLSGLLTGQREIAHAVGAKQYEKAVLAETKKALEAQGFDEPDFILKQLENSFKGEVITIDVEDADAA